MRLLRYNSLTDMADWVIDFPAEYYLNQGVTPEYHGNMGIDPEKVLAGQSVFVKTDLLMQVIDGLQQIKQPWHLLTGNSDLEIPLAVLEKLICLPNLCSWSGNNLRALDCRFLQIPIGINSLGTMRPNTFTVLPEIPSCKPIKICIAPITFTHPERQELSNWHLKDCYTAEERLSWPDYLALLGASKYSVCPRGNGMDTHRLMESIIMGAAPIVKSSWLNPLYQELGCEILETWNEMSNLDAIIKNTNHHAATFDYWYSRLQNHQTNCQGNL